MIPKMRAIAIDDERAHLDAIIVAATRAGFGCVPLHYPGDTDAEKLKAHGADSSHIRIIISDLHLDSASQAREPSASYAIIANLIYQLGLPDWTPFIFVLWTQHPTEADGLSKYLGDRLKASQMPGLLVTLDKADYNITSGEVDHNKLWADLETRIVASRGLNVLLQWEKEVIQCADNVVRRLLQVARSNDPALTFDEGMDRVLSSIAQTATSIDFASREPRFAVNGGLLPVLIDEMEHLSLDAAQTERWTAALASAAAAVKTSPLPTEVAILNDALHISRDGVASGSDRGAVLKIWQDEAEFEAMFGLHRNGCYEVFGMIKPPEYLTLMFVQIEGLCDSTQQKSGVVPFALACELPALVPIKSTGLQASIEQSPIYIGTDGHEKKLIVNLRYFFTVERRAAKKIKAEFRLRESMINKWAVAFAQHVNRPGTVEFFPPKPAVAPQAAEKSEHFPHPKSAQKA